MDFLAQPGRNYRRFRYENRYDTPLLIFFLDFAIGLMKVLLLLGLLAILWVSASKLLKPKPANNVDTALTEIKAGENTAVIEDKSPTVRGKTSISRASATPATVPAAAINNAAIVSPAVSEPAASVQPIITDEKWIRGITESHYIIQFGASVDTALFDEFIPVIDNGDPISIYPFKLTASGAPVYGIATGIYKNSDAALEAIELFSDEARAYEPWIRKVSDLNSQIDSVKKRIQAQ